MAHGLRHLRFECTRCGNCCRRFRVPLTGADLSRLMQATGKAPGELVQWLDPERVDMTGEPETFVVLAQGRRLMALGWLHDGCQHLEGDLCGVHSHRPASCRSYPFHAVLGKRKGIRRLQLLDMSDCKHVWGAATGAREVANAAAQQGTELAAYARQVQAFNRVQGHLARLSKALLGVDAFYARVLSARAGKSS